MNVCVCACMRAWFNFLFGHRQAALMIHTFCASSAVSAKIRLQFSEPRPAGNVHGIYLDAEEAAMQLGNMLMSLCSLGTLAFY